MNGSPKRILVVMVVLSVVSAPVVGLAEHKSGFRKLSASRRQLSVNLGQLSNSSQSNSSAPVSSFNFGNSNGGGKHIVNQGQLPNSGIQNLPQFAPKTKFSPVVKNPVLKPNLGSINKINPQVFDPTLKDKKPNFVNPPQSFKAPNALAGKLKPQAQSFVQNLIKKDTLLKVKKDFFAKQKNPGLGPLPKLQQAQKYILKCHSLSPKCGWWIPWYYHCYWNSCHHWCWDYWQPCHYYVIHCHAGYSYYFGAELFAIPGIGLGVASVTPGSPADFAGLTEGDMILGANNYALQGLDSGEVMKHAIRISGGVLNMEVQKEAGDQPVVLTALLKRVYHYSY